MSGQRLQFCDNCGEELGVFSRDPDEIFLSCGKAECNKEEQRAYREYQEELRERAQEDSYGRYR